MHLARFSVFRGASASQWVHQNPAAVHQKPLRAKLAPNSIVGVDLYLSWSRLCAIRPKRAA